MCPSVAGNGTVYVACNNYAAIAVSPDGGVLWSFQTGFGQEQIVETSTPVIAPDGTVYAASANRNLYALAPNGTVKWTFVTDRDYQTWNDGVVLLANGNLVCLPSGMGSRVNLTCLTDAGQVVWTNSFQVFDNHPLTAGSDGWVILRTSQGIMVYDSEGHFVTEIAGINHLGVGFQPENGVAVAPGGIVLIPDDDRLLALGIGRPTCLRSIVPNWDGTNVRIDWTAPSTDGGSPITCYKIYRFDQGTTLPSHPGQEQLLPYLIATLNGNATSYLDVNPAVDSTYLVQAANQYGESDNSGIYYGIQGERTDLILVLSFFALLTCGIAVVILMIKRGWTR